MSRLTRMCRPFSVILKSAHLVSVKYLWFFLLYLDSTSRLVQKFIQSYFLLYAWPTFSPVFCCWQKVRSNRRVQDEKSIKLMRDTGLAFSRTHTLRRPDCEWSDVYFGLHMLFSLNLLFEFHRSTTLDAVVVVLALLKCHQLFNPFHHANPSRQEGRGGKYDFRAR